ncbi:MAG: M20/M25/M40 family metallo-hydrolase [Anaerolineae bacterium]|nr:M20/M25/M40 family metallo-hydrolase [Anaerolineae bacterium]
MQNKIEIHLHENLPSYLHFLEDMVGINSFTGNPPGVNALGEYVANHFENLGFVAEQIQAENHNFGKHLILTRQGNNGPTIGLITHLDTVFSVDEEKSNDFHWRIDGDRIYGPGTNDIKGGTVMIYMVLEALSIFSPEIFEGVTWVILANAAEERLSEDFSRLCLKRLAENTIAALVFEAGVRDNNTFQLVTSRKGRATYKVTTLGKGAHAGSGHKDGANAIVQMADTIQKISDLTDYDHQLTYNIGKVAGGTVVNRVPHQVKALGEMRTYSPVVFEDGLKKLLELENQPTLTSVKEEYKCQVAIKIIGQTEPWPENAATESLLDIWKNAAQPLGLRVRREQRGGLSDGNFLWQKIPTIDGLGPYGANAHCSERSADGSKEQEFANRSSFVPKALLNIFAITKLIQLPG